MTWTRGLRWLGATGVAAFVAVSFTPLADVLSRWLNVTGSLDPAAAIVVLGGGGARADGTLTDTSLRRTLQGITLYRRGLAPLLVFLGEKSRHGFLEAEVRAGVARDCGIPAGAVLTESGARTTREESVRMRTQLLPRGIRRVLLITDVESMGRAKGVFERQGFDVVSAPTSDAGGGETPESRMEALRHVMMELVARAYYRLAGYL